MPSPSLPAVLAYCRPGFEGECAQELAALDAQAGGGGFARAARGSGFVEFVAPAADAIAGTWRRLVFARQLLRVLGRAHALPTRDRLGVLLPIIEDARLAVGAHGWCDAWVEAPDSDAARELAPLCRGLEAALIAALRKQPSIDRASPWRLHVCLTSTDAAFVAAANIGDSAPWRAGIPRLKFPHAAPSRSTLKLDEALLVLLDERERTRWLQPGLRAVDLGASPGGWTWQLVQRHMHVTAVDNGAIDAALLESGQVRHRREDGFHYRPPEPVDWMVCDMVESPSRIARLAAQWVAQGWCAAAIFNLKLPMKKRWEEVERCRALIDEALGGRGYFLRVKQLSHDREEVTAYLARRAAGR